jgi:plastocyanin
MKLYRCLIALIVVISTLSARAADVGVRIGDYWFNPTNVVIRPMDRIIWTNGVSNTHDATRAGLFASGNLGLNATYAFRFTNTGYYPYVCQRHISTRPQQTGTVSVVNISLASVTRTETNAQFEVRGGRQGLRAVVEAGGSLTALAPIATNPFPVSGTLRFTNNAPPPTNRFYRARVVP